MTGGRAVSSLDAARAALQRHFGHPEFLPSQAEVLPRVLAGETLLVVWPTGGGKSLLYQLPALLERGPTLVVSPLIALMHDQWQALRARGIAADALHSHLSRGDMDRTLQRLRAGETRLLYLAPERLRDPRVHHALQAAPHPVARIAIDEAHCITEWGHDFREDYMSVPRSRARLGNPPMLLLTATATPAVQGDIRACMEVADCPVVVGNLDRPNLWFGRRRVRSQREKLAVLARMLCKTTSPPSSVGARLASPAPDGPVSRPAPTETRPSFAGVGLIYCATRGQTEIVARHLGAEGIAIEAYHAGVAPAARAEIQRAFLADELNAVVATNAFGMGIDKPDVRWVVHFAHPGSLEAYYQEVGRVGRDGAPSRCVLLYSPHDAHVHRQFTREACPPVDRVIETFRIVCAQTDADGEAPLARPVHERLKHDLYLLEEVGLVEQEWRRGHRGSVHLRVQAAEAAAAAPTARAREVWAALDGAYDLTVRGGVGPVNLVGHAATMLRRPPADVEQALYDMETAGLIAYRPADGAVLYRVLGERVTRDHARRLGELIATRRRLRTGRLDAMRRFATTDGCLRHALLTHFGAAPAQERCGNCSACGPGT